MQESCLARRISPIPIAGESVPGGGQQVGELMILVKAVTFDAAPTAGHYSRVAVR